MHHESRSHSQYVNSRRGFNRGFTLVDVLVTTGVLGTLAGLAVPAFSNLMQSDRCIAQLNSLVASLNYARAEAVKRNANITVCPTANGLSCSGGTDWSHGWVVVDSNAGDPPLQRMPALTNNTTLSVAGSATGLTFESAGHVIPMTSTTVTICDARGATHAREIVVSSTGHVAAAPDAGHSLSGAPLRCP
jgi:type IV fimbrial biogenesis protein FimT